MFKNARIKLTAWYLTIIMLISLFFSIAVYRGFIVELRRGLRMQSFRMGFSQNIFTPPHNSVFNDLPGPLNSIFSPQDIDDTAILEIFNEARQRMIFSLAAINLGILITAGFAGYFLAGKTLHPIEVMVDDQKRFVADASHELRTPLTAMKSEIEVALRSKTIDKKITRDLLRSNLEEINKMQELSNYLLSLNRYQDGIQHLPFEPVDVFEAIKLAVNKHSAALQNKKIDIKTDVKEMVVNAHPDSLVEIFSILIDNAIKYSHTKGKILINGHKEGRNAVVTVQDFGVGIKSADLPYIFNRFYRADTSRNKTKVDGYGLGLSIAKSIIDLLRGTIRAESETDKGSKFIVSLPLASSRKIAEG